MLSDWLPEFCSRLRIFLSFDSAHRPLAEKIAQTLKNDGHRVFFDKESLPPGQDFNEQIRKAIRYSDRFLFLASRNALQGGRYTLTELEFARTQWPAPVGRVFSVIVDPGLKPDMLPVYLSSVQVLSIAGNTPAEIAAAIDRTSGIGTMCWACAAISTLALAGIIGLASGAIPFRASTVPANIAIVAPEFVHFRPRARPPNDPSAPGADTSWITSPVTITLPIAYSHANARAAGAQLVGEEVELMLGALNEKYTWSYVVEIIGDSIAEMRCDNWLCQKENVKAENLAPGGTSATRETMFLPTANKPLIWKTFIDQVTAPNGPEAATVVLKSRIINGIAGEFRCYIDVAGDRKLMMEIGYKPGQDPRPPTWQPRCQTRDQ